MLPVPGKLIRLSFSAFTQRGLIYFDLEMVYEINGFYSSKLSVKSKEDKKQFQIKGDQRHMTTECLHGILD